jgi:hypothetical protein
MLSDPGPTARHTTFNTWETRTGGKEIFFFFFAVLGLELRAFTLSLSTSPIFVKGFSR